MISSLKSKVTLGTQTSFLYEKNLLPWRSLYRLWGPLIIIKRCRDTTEYIPGMFLTSGTPAARLTTNSIASRAPKHQPNALKSGDKSQVFASKSTNLCVPKVTLLFKETPHICVMGKSEFLTFEKSGFHK